MFQVHETLQGIARLFRHNYNNVREVDSEIYQIPVELLIDRTANRFQIVIPEGIDPVCLYNGVTFAFDPDAYDFVTKDGEIQLNIFRTISCTVLLGRKQVDDWDYWEIMMEFPHTESQASRLRPRQ